MDGNRNNVLENKEEENKNTTEEENKNLLFEKGKNEDLNDIQNKYNSQEIKKSLLKNDNDKDEFNKNDIEKEKNTIITDYLITIQYTKYFNIPYFIFSKIIHLYFPCTKFQMGQINLSQIPTPPFAIVTEGCK